MSAEAEAAAKLLAKYGETISIVFRDYSGTDPVTGETIGTDTDTTIVCKGYPSQYLVRDIDGSTIQAGDIRLIVELIATRPARNGLAIVDGTTYRIMDVQPIRKAGADVIYICQIRAN